MPKWLKRRNQLKKQDSWQLQCDCGLNSMIESNDSINKIIAQTLNRIRKDLDVIRYRTPSLLTWKYIHLKYLHDDYVSAPNDPIFINLAFKANKREVLSQIKQRNENSNNPNRRWNAFTTCTDTIALLMSVYYPFKILINIFDFVITKIGANIFLDQTHRLHSYWHVDETSQNRLTKQSTADMNKHTKLCKEGTFYSESCFKSNNICNLERKYSFAANTTVGAVASQDIRWYSVSIKDDCWFFHICVTSNVLY